MGGEDYRAELPGPQGIARKAWCDPLIAHPCITHRDPTLLADLHPGMPVTGKVAAVEDFGLLLEITPSVRYRGSDLRRFLEPGFLLWVVTGTKGWMRLLSSNAHTLAALQPASTALHTFHPAGPLCPSFTARMWAPRRACASTSWGSQCPASCFRCSQVRGVSDPLYLHTARPW